MCALHRRSVFLFAVVICVATAAPAGAGSFSEELGSRDPYEKCIVLDQDQELEYSFRATSYTDFDIHYHEGDAVRYLDRQKKIREFEGTVTAPLRGTYCLMWKNREWAKTQLDYTLRYKGAPEDAKVEILEGHPE